MRAGHCARPVQRPPLSSGVELLEPLDRALDVALDQAGGGGADRPEQRAPPRSILTVKSHPALVGLTVIFNPYLVPPTPLPVTANSVGASSSLTVQVTRLRMPLTPATPMSVVPTSSSSGSSDAPALRAS